MSERALIHESRYSADCLLNTNPRVFKPFWCNRPRFNNNSLLITLNPPVLIVLFYLIEVNLYNVFFLFTVLYF